MQIDKLVDDAPSQTRTQLKCWYEGIDNGITQGMLAVEHKYVHPSISSSSGPQSWTRLGIVYDTGESVILT